MMEKCTYILFRAKYVHNFQLFIYSKLYLKGQQSKVSVL